MRNNPPRRLNCRLDYGASATPHGASNSAPVSQPAATSAGRTLPAYRDAAGFSLIEILVAFSILALSLGVLLNIFSGGLRTAIVSEEYQQALAIAESQLARVGTEIIVENGAVQGVDQDKFYWRIQANPFELPQADSDVAQQAPQMKAFQVRVIVEWEEGFESRAVQLNSIRLAKVQP